MSAAINKSLSIYCLAQEFLLLKNHRYYYYYDYYDYYYYYYYYYYYDY